MLRDARVSSSLTAAGVALSTQRLRLALDLEEPMKRRAATILVLLLAACGGSQGPQGPTGPQGDPGASGATGATGATGGYTSKDDVYCNTISMPSDPTVVEVTASCNATADLPLEGSCMTPPSGPDIALLESGPGAWSTSTTAAGWFCQWGRLSTSTFVNVPGGQDTMCCIKHP